MFTGIIRETGKVKSIRRGSNLWQIGVTSCDLYNTSETGDSISVNGVCLTLTGKKSGVLYFDVVKPTLNTTNLKRLSFASFVNLEPSLKIGDKLGGHFVLGHIDCESQIKSIFRQGDYFLLEVRYEKKFHSYIVEKGSIAVDGISLTIQKKERNSFTVSVIPYTFKYTNLKYKHVGGWVNVEFDYLLKKDKFKE